MVLRSDSCGVPEWIQPRSGGMPESDPCAGLVLNWLEEIAVLPEIYLPNRGIIAQVF